MNKPNILNEKHLIKLGDLTMDSGSMNYQKNYDWPTTKQQSEKYKDMVEYFNPTKVINCFKEANPLINKELRKVSVDEGLKIAEELLNILSERKDGLGLAANQVGYDAAVAVVNVKEPLILINPVIKEQWDELFYYEGCLSYPNKGIHTKRYKNIIIKTAQEESDWYFSGVETPGEGKGTWEEKQNKKYGEELRLLESVCIQHEIDHLNGLTIMDREYKREPLTVSKKWGRNEIVEITDGKDYKEMKYKKAKRFLDSGKWEIYIGGSIT